MQGAEERRLRRMSNTPQGGAIEGNAADDALMVDQGRNNGLTCLTPEYKNIPNCLGGGIGRRKGLKIPRSLVSVRVRFSSQAPRSNTKGLKRKVQALF